MKQKTIFYTWKDTMAISSRRDSSYHVRIALGTQKKDRQYYSGTWMGDSRDVRSK